MSCTKHTVRRNSQGLSTPTPSTSHVPFIACMLTCASPPRDSSILPEELATQSVRLKEEQLRREEEKLREIELKVQREINEKRQELLAKEESLRLVAPRGRCRQYANDIVLQKLGKSSRCPRLSVRIQGLNNSSSGPWYQTKRLSALLVYIYPILCILLSCRSFFLFQPIDASLHSG